MDTDRTDTVSAALSVTQRRVLVALKRRGEATADELAQILDISPSGARQHLSALRSGGYIASRQQRGQPGRPTDCYHATELTEALFATPDSHLTIELLESMDEEEPGLVTRLFERRRRRLAETASSDLAGKSIDERVGLLTDLLDEKGYLADFEKVDQDHYRINLHSCAIWPVASRYRQACASELGFIRDLLPGASVKRVTHKTSGAHTCAYEITIAD